MANANDYYNYGYLYFNGKDGMSKDYSKALEYFKKASELGNSAAMNYIGVMYQEGIGVEKDINTAIKYLEAAVRQDKPSYHAAYNLACTYYDGIQVQKDIPRATKLFEAVVIQGNSGEKLGSAYTNSCLYLGIIYYDSNPKKAFEYFITAAKEGKAEAWYNLGIMFESNMLYMVGTAPNVTIKTKSELTLTDKLIMKSQNDNLITACNYYVRAAELNHVQSMEKAANIYTLKGMHQEAQKWLSKAANMGSETAKKKLKLNNFMDFFR